MTPVPHIEPRGSGAQQVRDSSSGILIPESYPEPPDSPVREEPEAGLLLLPGGYVSDDGTVHREVEMNPVTGLEEEWITNLPPSSLAATVVTGLLTRCLVRLGSICPVPAGVVRDLLVSDREYLLLRLREMSFGPRVDSVIRCSNVSCGKPMDVSFSLADYAIEARPVTQRFFRKSLPSGHSAETDYEVEFRLPTGADQEILAPVFRKDEAAAANQLLARCVRRIGRNSGIGEPAISQLPDGMRRELTAEIERLSPRLVADFEAACPECGVLCSSTLDFGAFVLAEMKSSLLHLERDIHLLAWHYHWSERDLLSLTRGKRQRYVDMVNQELDRAIGIA